MTVKELKEKLENVPNNLEIMVGCLNRNGELLDRPAWHVENIEENKKTCVLNIFNSLVIGY